MVYGEVSFRKRCASEQDFMLTNRLHSRWIPFWLNPHTTPGKGQTRETKESHKGKRPTPSERHSCPKRSYHPPINAGYSPRMKTFTFSILASLLFATATEADATTFRFSGSITEVVDRGGTSQALNSFFSVGEAVAGSYTFEPTTLDVYPQLDNWGRYENAISSFTIHLGNYSASGISGDFNVRNNASGFDGYQVDPVISGPDVNGKSLHSKMNFHFNDSSQTVFDSDALPLTPPPPSSFTHHNDLRLFFNPEAGWVEFSVTEISQVPDSGSTLPIALFGFIALISANRLFRKMAQVVEP